MESNVVRNRDERRGVRELERLVGPLEVLVEASCGVERWPYTPAVAGSIPAAPTGLTSSNAEVSDLQSLGAAVDSRHVGRGKGLPPRHLTLLCRPGSVVVAEPAASLVPDSCV